MLKKEAEDVKLLAKPCYEAIKAIAGERECLRCDGFGYFLPNHISCSTCNGTGKVKWKWEPEWNDLILHDHTIGSYQGSQEKGSYLVLRPKDKYDIVVPKKDCIPILHWEKIEEILEGAGYWLEADKPLNKYIKKSWMKVHARIYEDIARNAAGNGKYVSCAEAKSRTKAVYEAVIELGREVKNNGTINALTQGG